MSMNNPKAQFQIDNGSGWETIDEVDIIDGVIPPPPNAFSMARALHKQIVYVGYTPINVTVTPDNPCDTHFAGYAKSLMDELLAVDDGRIDVSSYNSVDDETIEKYRTIIARRAYDLVLHTVWQTIPASGSTIKKYQGMTIEEITAMIPDLPVLPEVKE